MSQLFKMCFQDVIRAGRKSTTIRRWPARGAPLKPGRPSWAPWIGWLEIDAVEPIDLDALGEADARADGFDSADLLRDALLSLYPHHAPDGKAWYRVRSQSCVVRDYRTRFRRALSRGLKPLHPPPDTPMGGSRASRCAP